MTDRLDTSSKVEKLLWAHHDDYGNTLSKWKDYPATEDIILVPELVAAITQLLQEERREARIHNCGDIISMLSFEGIPLLDEQENSIHQFMAQLDAQGLTKEDSNG